MDKRPALNKAAVPADQIIKIPPTTCQYCNRPLSDYGCRVVAKGFWCLMVGLKEDPRTIIGPAPDPLKSIVEETREVKKAVGEHERAVAEEERLKAEWQAKALAAYSARQQRYQNSRTVLVDGVPSEWALPGTPTAAEASQLQSIADEALTIWQASGEKVIKARQGVDAARARARRQLSRVAA